MVPLFSWRSIIILTIGLIVGVGLGIVYFMVSLSLSSSGSGTWRNDVKIQVVNPSSSYLSLLNLQTRTIGYVAKARSLDFLEFLSQELADQAPEYHHTIDELVRMISIENDKTGDTPALRVVVTASTFEEAAFLTTKVPEYFKNYSIAEETTRQKQEQENILKTIGTVKKELLESKQQLSALAQQVAASDIQNNLEYIALKAKIAALDAEVAFQASELCNLIAAGNVGKYANSQQQEYEVTLQQISNVSVALSEAEKELQALELKRGDINKDAQTILLDAKAKALQTEIDKRMNGYSTVDSAGQVTRVVGLAEMISTGVTSGPAYANALRKVETASMALAEAKKELAVLESQSVSDSSGASEEDQTYCAVQVNVEELKTELPALREKLTGLARAGAGGSSQPDAQAAFERTSVALAEAKKELAVLENPPGDNGLTVHIDYQLVQANIKSLTDKLARLNDDLNASLVSNTNALQSANYLSIGKPDIPAPVIPVTRQTAMMIGGIAGIGVAWLVLNFRWLLSSSPQKEDDEA